MNWRFLFFEFYTKTDQNGSFFGSEVGIILITLIGDAVFKQITDLPNYDQINFDY
ncbi:MAG: hypothetical protein PHQ02_05315 [Candidatus Riflebacteria bacterium]|nr:hypothetical protein [Candidatus Riflebacteria bacterium]